MPAPVPALPQELWDIIHDIAKRDTAARVLQRAVRAQIQRAKGQPWDLPALIRDCPSVWGMPALFFTLTLSEDMKEVN